MLPFYSSFPQLPNQTQTQTPTSSAPPPQQNSMPIQHQFGGSNPQIPIPFSNSSNFLSNGHGVPMTNVPPSMATRPGFMNAQNPLLPLQNNNLGMSHLGSVAPIPQLGQPHVGFGPQSSVNSMNSVGSFPFRGQVCNLVQQGNPSPSPGQAFGHNLLNLPQQLNQSIGLPFGQFCMPNQLQNINQFLPMQMSNPSQFVPHNAYGFLNQASQATVPQNPTFFANPQFGNVQCNQVAQQVNQSQHNLHPTRVDVNAWRPSPVGTQQWQGNSSTPNISSSIQPDKTDNLQPSAVKGSQGNPTKVNGHNNSNSNWRNPQGKNFTRNPKRGVQQRGFQNSQFHHMNNGKKKFGFPNGQKGKGLSNERAGKHGIANSSNQGREQRSSLSLLYSEQEIKQWREERKKHYPSKANIDKKLAEKVIGREVFEREAQIRREQLKEILAKQAELGVEVAEIPSYYLSDSKKQHGHGREESRGPMTKNGRLQNKFNKRGRYDRKDRFAKKQRLHDNGSSDVPSLSRRKPTLLQKLLDTDVRRDKNRLMQVFRFMALNSYFKDWPEKPLNFPSVIVKKSGCGDIVVEEMSPHEGKDVSQVSINTMVENVDDNDDDEEDDDDNDDNENENDEDVQEEGEIIN